MGNHFYKLPNCPLMLFSSVNLLIFNFLIYGFEPLIRRANICLQVEELATIEFHWLGGGEVSTCFCLLHRRFFSEHKHPIELLLLFSDGIVSQDMPDVGVTDTHPSICL